MDNITPLATKVRMLIRVRLLYILLARRCMLNKMLVEISIILNLVKSAKSMKFVKSVIRLGQIKGGMFHWYTKGESSGKKYGIIWE